MSLSGLAYAAELGWRDLAHELTGFVCQALAFTAVLAPLLILWGLKSGVISTLVDQLQADPRTLQVTVVDERTVDLEWIEALAADPLVGFAMPHTRSLAAGVEFVPAGRRDGIVPGTLLASGTEDPLLPAGAAPPGPGEAVISAALADALGVERGDGILLVFERRLDGRAERIMLEQAVTGITPLSLWQTRGALVHLDTLTAIERWRDGYAVPARGWSGRPAPSGEYPYASFRLYAADLVAVRPLAEKLVGMGMDVRSRLADVEAILGLNRSLTAIFAIIAGVAGIGYALAFGATLWANVMRKTHEISLLRLQGMPRAAVVGFPLAQALAVAGAGAAGALAAYFGASLLINRLFGEGLMIAGAASRLTAEHVVIALGAGFAVALLAAGAAAYRIIQVDPAGGLDRV